MHKTCACAQLDLRAHLLGDDPNNQKQNKRHNLSNRHFERNQKQRPTESGEDLCPRAHPALRARSFTRETHSTPRAGARSVASFYLPTVLASYLQITLTNHNTRNQTQTHAAAHRATQSNVKQRQKQTCPSRKHHNKRTGNGKHMWHTTLHSTYQTLPTLRRAYAPHTYIQTHSHPHTQKYTETQTRTHTRRDTQTHSQRHNLHTQVHWQWPLLVWRGTAS